MMWRRKRKERTGGNAGWANGQMNGEWATAWMIGYGVYINDGWACGCWMNVEHIAGRPVKQARETGKKTECSPRLLLVPSRLFPALVSFLFPLPRQQQWREEGMVDGGCGLGIQRPTIHVCTRHSTLMLVALACGNTLLGFRTYGLLQALMQCMDRIVGVLCMYPASPSRDLADLTLAYPHHHLLLPHKSLGGVWGIMGHWIAVVV